LTRTFNKETTTLLVIPDLEFFMNKIRSPGAFKFPAQNLSLARMNKSRRAQLLLSCAKSNKQCEPEVNEFVEIFKNKKILVVTLEALNERLNYLESSLIEWHIKRGLPEQYAGKNNIIVMSSEDDVKRQEIFEFDSDSTGYF